MYSFKKSVFINRPPQVVFDFVTNPATITQWEGTTESVEWITDGPPGVGSIMKVEIKMGWFKIKEEMEITDWEPFTLYSYKGLDENLQGSSRITFEEKENGTQVTINAQLKGVGLARILEGFFGRQAEKQDSRNFDTLKLLLEAN